MQGLIGIYTSAMGSGKSEVAKVLAELGYRNVPFAGPLKQAARALLLAAGYPEKTVEWMLFTPEGKQTPLVDLGGITPRQLMQDLGSWGRRAVPGGLWLPIWKAKVERLLAEGDQVCVDDLRYPDEMEAVYRLGGCTWRVVRPGAEVTRDHESERDWTKDPTPGSLGGDWIIINDGTLEALHAEVLNVARGMESHAPAGG